MTVEDGLRSLWSSWPASLSDRSGRICSWWLWCPPAASDHTSTCRTKSLRLVGRRLESGCALHVHHAFRPKGHARAPEQIGQRYWSCRLTTNSFKSLWCRAGKEFKSRSSGLLSITLFQHAVILPARDGVTGQVFEFHGPRPRHSCFSGHSVLPRYVSLQEAIPSPS